MNSSAPNSTGQPRILLAHNRYLIRGGEQQVFEAEADLLRDHGHVVETYLEDNERVAELGQARTAARTVWSAETYQAARRILRDGRIDLVHVHNFFPLISPAIYYAARAERVPVVQTLHNYRLLCVNGLLFRDGAACEACVGRAVPWPGIRHACYRDSRGGSATVATMLAAHRAIGTWGNMVDAYIALSDFSRGKFIEGGLPGDKIWIKPNFAARDPGPGRGQGGYALYAGRLSPEKGVATLLDAWRQLDGKIPLWIVGDGPLVGKVAEAAEAVPAIRYLGRVPNEDVLRYMQAAAFLVAPSECYENFPMIIVEAYAAGLPVLASDLGSTGSLVQAGQTGRHFVVGNAADLAQQALRLMDNPAGLDAMRATARATYEARYTAAANYRQLRDIYDRVLARYNHAA